MKKDRKFWLSLIIFSLVGQVAWVMENMYLNVFIYKEFNASAEAISLMVGASSVAATVTTLLIGALSDKLGKRKIGIAAPIKGAGTYTVNCKLGYEISAPLTVKIEEA